MSDAVKVRCVRESSPKHRATDWRLREEAAEGLGLAKTNHVVCGICHPSPFSADLILTRQQADALKAQQR